MENLTQLIGEQAKILLENNAWVREKIDSLETETQKREFLAVASMYALSKMGVEF